MKWFFSIVYIAVAVLVFFSIRRMKNHISQSKHYSRHPDKFKHEFGGWVSDALVAILWPLQIIGIFIAMLKG